jgi:hypothetical protein
MVAASAMVLQAIVVSSDTIPEALCVVCYNILRISAVKFPTERYMAVAGFFMLRIVCPAIASPKQYGIIGEAVNLPAVHTPRSGAEDVGLEALKSLAMISKLLLMASIGQRFEVSDAADTNARNNVFNTFLASASTTVQTILDTLVVCVCVCVCLRACGTSLVCRRLRLC